MVPEELAGLRRLYLGFIASRAVITANNLGVFDCLKKPMTAAEAAKRLKCDRPAMGILLDALTGIGLVRKSTDGAYRNAAASGRYLVKGGRLYQGDIVEACLIDVAELLRSGRGGDDRKACEKGR